MFQIKVVEHYISYKAPAPPNYTMGQGRQRCAPTEFCTEFNAQQLSFEAFSHIMRIFGSGEPQTESTFPFLYIIIFQRWESFELSLVADTTYALVDFFAQNSMPNNVYFKLFPMRCVFLAASSLKLNLLSRFCT